MSSNQIPPKYETHDIIILKSGRMGIIDCEPVIHPEYNSWYYAYSYGLGGTSEGYVLECDINHKKTKIKKTSK